MALRIQHRLAATAVFAALALPALAQPQPPLPTPANATSSDARPGHRHAHGDRAQFAEKRAERRAEHRAQRLAALKSTLNLTPAQESAWTTYTTALQPGERHARLDMRGMDKLTTPERIDRMRAVRAQHAAEADRRGEATKAFYATLAPEQQKTFDAKAHQRPHRHAMAGKHHKRGDGAQHHGHRGSAGHRGAPGAAPAAPAQ